jgi:hypothetical protein
MATAEYAKNLTLALINPKEQLPVAIPSLMNARGYILSSRGNGTVTTESTCVNVVAVFDQMSFTSGRLGMNVYQMNSAGACMKQTFVPFDRSATNYLEFAALASKIVVKNASSPNDCQGQPTAGVLDGVFNPVTITQTDLASLSMTGDYVQGYQADAVTACLIDMRLGGNRLLSGEGVINPGDKGTYQSDFSSSLAEFTPIITGSNANEISNDTVREIFSTANIAITNPAGKKNPVNFRTSSVVVDYNFGITNATANGDFKVKVNVTDAAGVVLSTVSVHHDLVQASATSYELSQEVHLEDFSGAAHDVTITAERTVAGSGNITFLTRSVTIKAERQGMTSATNDKGIAYFILDGLNASASLSFGYYGVHDIKPSFNARQSIAVPKVPGLSKPMARQMVEASILDPFKVYKEESWPNVSDLAHSVKAAYHSDEMGGSIKASHGIGGMFSKIVHGGRDAFNLIHKHKRAIGTGLRLADRMAPGEGYGDAADVVGIL